MYLGQEDPFNINDKLDGVCALDVGGKLITSKAANRGAPCSALSQECAQAMISSVSAGRIAFKAAIASCMRRAPLYFLLRCGVRAMICSAFSYHVAQLTSVSLSVFAIAS